MKELKFKTNINCGGCVAKVTPLLDKEESIASWAVDTQNPDRILTVKTENATEADVINTVKQAGFKAETVN